ncbi:MAG: Ax21 family protein [Arenimonas sp.]|nr:Ax21 family protein [Arenimonas sp.]
MKRSLIALALVALLPLSAQADDKLSYTYIEGNYVNVDGDADGFGARGSVAFGESNFYGFGSYSMVEVDDVNVDIDLTDIGLGYAFSLSDNADLISEIAYVNADVDGLGSADGYRASVGVRGSFSDNFEGLVKANYIDGSDVDGDFSGTVGAQYKFTQTWGVTGEVEFADGGETYLVGLRASF